MKNQFEWKLENPSTLKGLASEVTACGCIGPQNGEPLCPCMMRARRIYKKDGRWIEPEKDLGPVSKGSFE